MRHLRHKQMIANHFTNKSPCCALATLEIFDQNQARSEETAILPTTQVEQQYKSKEMEIDEKNSRGRRGKKEATEKKKSTWTYEEKQKRKKKGEKNSAVGGKRRQAGNFEFSSQAHTFSSGLGKKRSRFGAQHQRRLFVLALRSST